MESFVVRKQVEIKGDSSKVWQALTSPELTKKYFFNCKIESQWIVGGPISFKGKVFWIFPIEMSGKILKMDRGRFLQYSLKNRNSSSESIVTDELYEDNGKTILTITDDVGQDEGAEGRYERSLKGWDKVLNGLKKVVETEMR